MFKVIKRKSSTREHAIRCGSCSDVKERESLKPAEARAGRHHWTDRPETPRGLWAAEKERPEVKRRKCREKLPDGRTLSKTGGSADAKAGGKVTGQKQRTTGVYNS